MGQMHVTAPDLHNGSWRQPNVVPQYAPQNLDAPDAVVWGRRSVLTVRVDLIELKRDYLWKKPPFEQTLYYCNSEFKAWIPVVAKIAHKWKV
jgi:hypothetical protein